LQPEVSNRSIAKVLGVDENTVRADQNAGNPAPQEKKPRHPSQRACGKSRYRPSAPVPQKKTPPSGDRAGL